MFFDRKRASSFDLFLLFVACAFITCSNQQNPLSILQEPGDGKLHIRTERLSYSWRAQDPADNALIIATLTNNSEETFYTRLGDAFSGRIMQELFFVAEGSDGHIEKSVQPGDWMAMPRGILIEGVSWVEIRPAQTYALHAFLDWPENDTGQFRLKVEFFRDMTVPEDGASLEDFSNIFKIVK